MHPRSIPAKICRRLLAKAEDIEAGAKSALRKEFPDCYETIRAFSRVCSRPIRVVYDIGASRGGWSRTFHAFYPSIEQLVLFEPATPSLLELRKLVLPNVVLAVNESALGAIDGLAVLHGGGATASLLESNDLQHRFFSSHTQAGSERVKIAALDAEVSRRRYASPDLIKIDVQGLEWDVMKGGQTTLAVCSWIIIEFSTVPLYSNQESFSKILEWLEARGWRMVAIGYQWRSPAGQLLQFDAILTRERPN